METSKEGFTAAEIDKTVTAMDEAFPKEYRIIYADPPWDFSRWSDKSHKHVTKHYGIMQDSDILNLTLPPTEKDAVLLLWATYPNLPLALETLSAWGFRFSTVAFTWVKTNRDGSPFMGMGYYTRSNAEICLLGIKGKPLPRQSHSVPQVLLSPRLKHSEKPQEVRERIVELFGDIPRIELFARKRVRGWDVWGNEAPEEYYPLQEKLV